MACGRQLAFIVSLQLIVLTHRSIVANALPATSTPALEFIVLHNNDMHSRFEQTGKYSTACHPSEAVGNRCYGGFARVSTLVKQYRSQAENGGTSVLFLNAGDTYTGTPWFTLYRDRIVAAFLNKLKPDAIVSFVKSTAKTGKSSYFDLIFSLFFFCHQSHWEIMNWTWELRVWCHCWMKSTFRCLLRI